MSPFFWVVIVGLALIAVHKLYRRGQSSNDKTQGPSKATPIINTAKRLLPFTKRSQSDEAIRAVANAIALEAEKGFDQRWEYGRLTVFLCLPKALSQLYRSNPKQGECLRRGVNAELPAAMLRMKDVKDVEQMHGFFAIEVIDGARVKAQAVDLGQPNPFTTQTSSKVLTRVSAGARISQLFKPDDSEANDTLPFENIDSIRTSLRIVEDDIMTGFPSVADSGTQAPEPASIEVTVQEGTTTHSPAQFTGPVAIGRGQHNDIVLQVGADSGVSRNHATIRRVDGNHLEWVDTSSYGSYLNGEHVSPGEIRVVPLPCSVSFNQTAGTSLEINESAA